MAKLTKALKDSKGNIGKTENEKNSGKEQFLKKDDKGNILNENQDGQVYSSLNKSYGLYLNKPDDYSSGFKVNISSTSEINKGVERNLREDINVKKLEDVYQTKKQEQDFSFAKGEARAQVKEFGSKDEENLINDPNIKRLKDGYQTQRAK